MRQKRPFSLLAFLQNRGNISELGLSVARLVGMARLGACLGAALLWVAADAGRADLFLAPGKPQAYAGPASPLRAPFHAGSLRGPASFHPPVAAAGSESRRAWSLSKFPVNTPKTEDARSRTMTKIL